MAKTTLSTIKNWFKTGLKPTQLQFWAVFDSFFHKDEKIPVSSIEYLQNYLNAKAEKEAFEVHIDHYGSPLINLGDLAAIPQNEISNNQRRYVHSEGVDYFYDVTLVAGDLAPTDQVGGTGFWMRGAALVEVIDTLVSTETEKPLSANQGRVLQDFIGANTALFADYILLSEKGTANGVAILDSNGKIVDSQLGDLAITDVITPTETTLALFQTNNANYTYQKGDLIIIDDGSGNLSHYIFKGGDKTLSASYSLLNATKIPISAVIGLQAALDGKAGLDNSNAFSKLQSFLGGSVATDIMQIINSTSGEKGEINLQPTGGLRLTKDRVSFIEFLYNFATNGIVRSFTFPDKNGTIALMSDLAALAPKTKPTKTINNVTQYTAILEDKDKFLVFTTAIDFIVPANLFAADDEISARNKAAGDVTVVDGAGMTVQVVSSQSKLVPQFGFFGLRFETTTVSGLLGQLKPI